jgi:hypothetical protein
MSSPTPKITIVSNGDDWEGLYLDGVLFCQDHKVTTQDVASALDLEVDNVYVSCKWLGGKVSSLPDKLSKVPKKWIQ